MTWKTWWDAMHLVLPFEARITIAGTMFVLGFASFLAGYMAGRRRE